MSYYGTEREIIENLEKELAAAQAEIAALKAKDLTKFEPDWMQYKMGLRDGYAEAQEQAAKVCEQQEAADHCAAAIRAMQVEK
jgi:multidrug resistance efflux pump